MSVRVAVKTCILAFFIAAALAYSILAVAAIEVEYPTETTVTGRVVGDSPQELNQQLEIDELKLTQALYVPAWNSQSLEKASLLKGQFHDEFTEFTGGMQERIWDWGAVTGEIEKFKRGQYFIVERKSGKSSTGEMLNRDTVAKWVTPFRNSNPLFIFNTEYGGLHLPKEDNYLEQVSQDAVTISTNAYYSDEFTRAVICNLGLHETVGDAFREARNEYYRTAHNTKFLFFRTHGESIGLSLYSYMLYGNPLVKVTIPGNDKERLKNYCGDYAASFQPVQISAQSIDISPEQGNVFSVTNPRVDEDEGWGFIAADNLNQMYAPFEPVLPYQVIRYDFPIRTVINDVAVKSWDDPIDFSAQNLPSWNNGLVDRICAENTKPAGIEFSHTFTEDKEIVLIQINPVEVVDCEKGLFRLYQKVTYGIDFIPYSDVMIREVNSPASGAPGSEATVEVDLQNIKEDATSGKLVVRNGKDVLAAQMVELFPGEAKTAGLSFSLPDAEGSHTFVLEYLDGEELLTSSKFQVDVYNLKLGISAPSKVGLGEDAEIKVTVMSNDEPGEKAYSATYSLLKGDSQIVSGSFEGMELSPGENILPVKLKTEGLEPGSYAFETTVSSGDYIKTESAQIFVAKLEEEAPQLADMPELNIQQGAIASLKPFAVDLNGDHVTYSFSEPLSRFGKWQTGKHHEGKYEVDVVASDGKTEDRKTVTITVTPGDSTDSFADNEEEKEFTFSKEREEKTAEIRLLKKAKVTEATITLEAGQP